MLGIVGAASFLESGDAGIVDEDVERADLTDYFGPARLVANIEAEEARADRRGGGAAELLVDVGGPDRRTLGDEGARDRFAYPLGGAGDQRRLSFKSVHGGSLSDSGSRWNPGKITHRCP